MNLQQRCEEWVGFLPRDAKTSTFTFELLTADDLRATYRIKFAFYTYIETRQFGYSADSLFECLCQFRDGANIGDLKLPAHQDMRFVPKSLKVVTLAAGYARPQALSKLAAVLEAAFPPVDAASPISKKPRAKKRSTR